jgi:cation diffusion facilitator family transporter
VSDPTDPAQGHTDQTHDYQRHGHEGRGHEGRGHEGRGHEGRGHEAHNHVGHGHSEHEAPGHQHEHEHRGGVRGWVVSVLRPHSHDAADSVDRALEASQDGVLALKISLAALAVTAVLQAVIVAVTGSVALLSDTIHNFADALTAIPLGLAFWLGRRPANSRYTYGYGRSEDLAGVFIVVTIAASSAVAAWEAINRLLHPHSVHHLPWIAAAGLVGFLGNELVARYRIRVGRRIGSAALVADGLHARTDGFTSLAVVVGAAGAALGWRLADPIVGLVITVAILSVVKNAAVAVYRRLMDAVDPNLVKQVTTLLEGEDGVDGVDGVRIRWIGHELHAEAEITSAGDLTLDQAHQVAERAHHRLLHDVPRLAQATIHTSPSPIAGVDPHALTEHHRPPR